MKKLYLTLTVIGLIAPYALVALFVREYGWNPTLFWEQMWANYISSLEMTDLTLSCVVFWIWMFREGSRHRIGRLWIYVAVTLSVGLCFALPLFLYVREQKLEAERATGATATPARMAMEGAA
jgi:hypothetical protein